MLLTYIKFKYNIKDVSGKGECEMKEEFKTGLIPLDIRLYILDVLYKSITQNAKVEELVENILDAMRSKING